ncbi:MAG TPA: hypothetical protein VGN27_05515 [Gaiellaceae bacterium]|nr:hypothetical protein [Gaiellaceae bacterium]
MRAAASRSSAGGRRRDQRALRLRREQRPRGDGGAPVPAGGGRQACAALGRSAPGAAVHPVVLEALAEVGIDASDHVPRLLDADAIAWADVVVATCDDACPVVPGKRYVNWQLPDPKGKPLEEVRAIRDDIAARVAALAKAPDLAA